MYIGWTKNGRPFTEKEFNNSYLKKNSGRGLTYAKYLSNFKFKYENAEKQRKPKNTFDINWDF
jgi:hypothetical protein